MPTVIRCGALIDGSGADPVRNASLTLDGNTITAVDRNGVVTGKGVGPVTIRATLEGIEGALAIDAVVTLRPLVIARTPVRAARLDRGPGSVGTIVSRPAVRATRLDGRVDYDAPPGVNAPSVIVGRPRVGVERSP